MFFGNSVPVSNFSIISGFFLLERCGKNKIGSLHKDLLGTWKKKYKVNLTQESQIIGFVWKVDESAFYAFGDIFP